MTRPSDRSLAGRSRPASLLCQLGWHAPEPLARWNDGYYFTRCKRCRCDLIRTLYSDWQVPRGFRVVWQSHPPVSHATRARLVRERASEAPRTVLRSNAPSETELPIQEVLRHLQKQDQRQPPRTAPEEVDEAPEPAPAGQPDFVSPQPVSPQAPKSVASGIPAAGPQGAVESAAAVEAEPPTAAVVEQEAAPEPKSGPHEEAARSPEAEARGPSGPQWVEPDAAGARRVSRVPDFMADWPATTDWEYVPTLRRPRAAEPEPDAEPEREPRPAPPEAVTEAVEAEPAAAAEATALPDAPAGEGPLAPAPRPSRSELLEPEQVRPVKPHFEKIRGPDGEPRLGRIVPGQEQGQPTLSATATLLAVALPLLLLVAVLLLSRGPRMTETVAQRVAPSPLPTQAAPQPAFVTASVLNCRAAPARQAEPVRRLARGAQVAMIARDGEWISIAYRGQQCWALLRYIAKERPA